MLHEIDSFEYRCEFAHKKPIYNQDYVLVFDDEQVLLKQDSGSITIPKICDIANYVPDDKLSYLFSVSEVSFYLCTDKISETDGLQYQPIQTFRNFTPQWLAFAGVTAYHLHYWYQHNRYCGQCGAKFDHKDTERAMICPQCGYTKYPEIAVAVIVGITNGNELLLTKYSSGYNRYALIAGFVEIGESLEDTVRREVYEEVGLRIKNIKYYGNQPWGFTRSLLAGFFAEVDGTKNVTLDTTELSEAAWVKREDIPVVMPKISLTATMMDDFKQRKIL